MKKEDTATITVNLEEVARLEKEYKDLQFQMSDILAKREEVRKQLVERRQWKYL